jgi:hypothetical protein
MLYWCMSETNHVSILPYGNVRENLSTKIQNACQVIVLAGSAIARRSAPRFTNVTESTLFESIAVNRSGSNRISRARYKYCVRRIDNVS